MMKINKYLLAGLLFSLCTKAFSQSITNVDYEVKDENIIITYDLNGVPNTKYQIEVKFLNKDGTQIIPKTMNGDVGVVTGGQDKQIHWSVTVDTDGLDGEYKVVITITDKIKEHDKNKAQHAFLYNANIPLTLAGVRYTYLRKVGAYVSVSHDLYLIYADGVFMGTAGVSFRATGNVYPYAGGGVDFYSGSPVAEAGITLKIDRLVFDLGAGFNLLYYSNVFPFGYAKVGIGYCFNL
jgi:hypothetical protein